jgi:hypothetical protein
MKKRILIFIVCTLAFSFNASPQEKLSGVAVIAPSVSTSMKAREIRMKLGWQELSVKKADVVLVVVRSALYLPLMPSYRSYCKLEEDAENQLNIAGPQFHVYLYSIKDDLSVVQLEHKSFDAD